MTMKWWICVTVSVDWNHMLGECVPVQAVSKNAAYQVLRTKQERHEDIAYVIGPFNRKPTQKIGVPSAYDADRE